MRKLVKILFALVVILMFFGIILVFSASGTYSAMKFDSIYVLFKSHLWKVIIAFVALVVFASIPYENYKKHSKILILGIIFLLLLTLIIAPKVKGASRWIDLGFVQFQPSELAKIIIVMHLASMIERKDELIKDFQKGFLLTMVWIVIVAGLVLIQPNVSTSAIIVLLSFTILFVGGARLKHVLGTLGGAAAFGGIVMMIFSHSRERVLGYVNSIVNGGDLNIQVKQAKIALGSGGILGVGLGHSRQSDLFLPESYGDFIFSILGEELGLVGTITILIIYLSIFLIGLIIAKRSDDRFGQLLGFGISFNIVFSAFINAGVVAGILPTTGITLPFISFGGTSIIIFAMSVGILINIANQSAKKQELRAAQVG
ncbi:MAG: putative lipid II flippase FtsW [Bacteroidetes bacterium]|nr:putative lipid II flippase FtsW [Bacteroidota bacterium]